MPPKPPETAPDETLYAKAATFINGVDIPGYSVVASVNVERQKTLSLVVAELGLLITGGGQQTLIPFANLKAIYLA